MRERSKKNGNLVAMRSENRASTLYWQWLKEFGQILRRYYLKWAKIHFVKKLTRFSYWEINKKLEHLKTYTGRIDTTNLKICNTLLKIYAMYVYESNLVMKRVGEIYVGGEDSYRRRWFNGFRTSRRQDLQRSSFLVIIVLPFPNSYPLRVKW